MLEDLRTGLGLGAGMWFAFYGLTAAGFLSRRLWRILFLRDARDERIKALARRALRWLRS